MKDPDKIIKEAVKEASGILAEHLHPGDYLSYAGDAPHVFEALAPGTSAVLISEQR